MLKTLTVYNSGNTESLAIRTEILAEATFDKDEINISGMDERNINAAIAALTDTYDAIYVCVLTTGTFASGKITTTQEAALAALLNPAPFTKKQYKQRRPTNKIEDFMLHHVHRSSINLPFIMTNLFNQAIV